jgi:hypothetical protein
MSLLKNKIREIVKKQEAERQRKVNVESNTITINCNSRQYKALTNLLEKNDTAMSDAIRMALHYLESEGSVGIDKLKKFIK